MVISNRNFAEQVGYALDRVFTSAQPVPPEEWLGVHLTLDNDGSTRAMNVDGSVTTQKFQYIVPAGKLMILSRVIWTMADLNIQYLDWFGFGAKLTKGCILRAMDAAGGVLIKYIHDLKRTIEFAHLAGTDVPLFVVDRGVSPDIMVVRWSLFKTGFVFILKAGESIQFRIRDDLRNMDHFECVLQGRLFDD